MTGLLRCAQGGLIGSSIGSCRRSGFLDVASPGYRRLPGHCGLQHAKVLLQEQKHFHRRVRRQAKDTDDFNDFFDSDNFGDEGSLLDPDSAPIEAPGPAKKGRPPKSKAKGTADKPKAKGRGRPASSVNAWGSSFDAGDAGSAGKSSSSRGGTNAESDPTSAWDEFEAVFGAIDEDNAEQPGNRGPEASTSEGRSTKTPRKDSATTTGRGKGAATRGKSEPPTPLAEEDGDAEGRKLFAQFKSTFSDSAFFEDYGRDMGPKKPQGRPPREEALDLDGLDGLLAQQPAPTGPSPRELAKQELRLNKYHRRRMQEIDEAQAEAMKLLLDYRDRAVNRFALTKWLGDIMNQLMQHDALDRSQVHIPTWVRALLLLDTPAKAGKAQKLFDHLNEVQARNEHGSIMLPPEDVILRDKEYASRDELRDLLMEEAQGPELTPEVVEQRDARVMELRAELERVNALKMNANPFTALIGAVMPPACDASSGGLARGLDAELARVQELAEMELTVYGEKYTPHFGLEYGLDRPSLMTGRAYAMSQMPEGGKEDMFSIPIAPPVMCPLPDDWKIEERMITGEIEDEYGYANTHPEFVMGLDY